jgi:peptide chain release factor subunit 3
LVISSKHGEFETGLEKDGETREHVLSAKIAGIKHLIVLVNKMDHWTVLWDLAR